MSLVFTSREISAGPTVALQADVAVLSPDAHVSKQTVTPISTITADRKKHRVSCILGIGDSVVMERDQTGRPVKPVGSLEGSSVSGVGEESDDASTSTVEDGEDEVQSKFNGALGSMGSLEESLPIKRGLSNFYSGKSKSFANLSEITTVRDLVKQENPFNKRRRTLIKWSRRTFSSSVNLTLMPALALNEDEENEEL